MIYKLKCRKCKHQWYPRREILPKVCSKCKADTWNLKNPKVRKAIKALGPEIKVFRKNEIHPL